MKWIIFSTMIQYELKDETDVTKLNWSLEKAEFYELCNSDCVEEAALVQY